MDRVKALLAGLATLMAAGVAEPCFAREICGLSEASFEPSNSTSIAGGLGPALGVSPNHTEVRGYPFQFVRDASGVWRIDSM